MTTGPEDFVDIFLGSSQNWASLRVISMPFAATPKRQNKGLEDKL